MVEGEGRWHITYKVEILPVAWEDLKRIEDWYLVQFDVETALKVRNHILSVIERLGEFPDSGSLTPDEWLNQQGYSYSSVLYVEGMYKGFKIDTLYPEAEIWNIRYLRRNKECI